MQLPDHLLSMAGELDPSFWTMLGALAQSLDFGTALTMELVLTTVAIRKMLVPRADFGVSNGEN